MTTLPDEDEWGELVAAQFNRVDLVKAGANGIPLLIAKQDADTAGMLPPDYVRSLIAKAEPDQPEERVTMTGSPAAIAALIHNASVAKAKLSGGEMNDLPDSAFAFIESGGKKDASGKTTPRSLRHFPIHDKAHADNAAARIAQGAKFGKEAAGKVHAAQKKFGEKVSKADAGDMLDAQLDGGTDGLDPTVPLCAPDDDAPGDPTDPGSPAWEAIDAATAGKWCTILSRARVALSLLAERESLEAASADPDDIGNAYELGDACCAIDYAISVLAPFAVSEQSEADCGAEEMAAIGKAAAAAEEPLSVVEPLAAVAKAGRVLSAANEQLIRTAGESLNRVLASLPQAPVADDTITKETAVAADETKSEPESVAKDAAGPGAGGEPETVAKDAQAPAEPQADVAKADAAEGEKPKMVIVYDAKGNVVGIVDPGDITAVQGAAAPSSTEAEPEPRPEAEAAAPADPADMTPAPAAAAGTPADDVAKADEAEPAAKADDENDPQAVLKSTVTAAMREVLDGDPAKEEIRKQAGLIAAQSQEIEALKARLETVENTPAAPKVFTNGAVPPADQMRGQDRAPAGMPQVDVAKAAELKKVLYNGDPADQNAAFNEMQQGAIGALAAIHGSR